MKKLLSSFIVLLAFSLSSCNSAEIDYSEWLEKGVLIDTRTQEEFNSGHAEDAILIPYDQMLTQITEHVSDKKTPILLYCRSGRRAGIAEKALQDQGYENVHNVGGLDDIEAFISEYGK